MLEDLGRTNSSAHSTRRVKSLAAVSLTLLINALPPRERKSNAFAFEKRHPRMMELLSRFCVRTRACIRATRGNIDRVYINI